LVVMRGVQHCDCTVPTGASTTLEEAHEPVQQLCPATRQQVEARMLGVQLLRREICSHGEMLQSILATSICF